MGHLRNPLGKDVTQRKCSEKAKGTRVVAFHSWTEYLKEQLKRREISLAHNFIGVSPWSLALYFGPAAAQYTMTGNKWWRKETAYLTEARKEKT